MKTINRIKRIKAILIVITIGIILLIIIRVKIRRRLYYMAIKFIITLIIGIFVNKHFFIHKFILFIINLIIYNITIIAK